MVGEIISGLYNFENRERTLFPEVYYRMRFCLLTLSGINNPVKEPEFVFFALRAKDLQENDLRFKLTIDDLYLINPNTSTCPIFRSKRDAELVKAIYRNIPVLVSENNSEDNSWSISFLRMFDMANDAELFSTVDYFMENNYFLEGNVFRKTHEEYLPLYEGRMINIFDHRLASVVSKEIKLVRSGESHALSEAEKEDPETIAMPRYWVSSKNAAIIKSFCINKWIMGYMDITSATNARTSITSIIPFSGLGHTVIGLSLTHSAKLQSVFLANFTSFVLDYLSRWHNLEI
jgi:hypothetical protein